MNRNSSIKASGLSKRLILPLIAVVAAAAVAFVFLSGALNTTRASANINQISTPSRYPWGATSDTKGNVWVAQPGCDPHPFTCGASQTGSIALVQRSPFKVVTNFTQPSGKGLTSPFFPVLDAAGDIWFTEPNSNAIGEFMPNLKNPASSTWQQWSVPTHNAAPFDLAFDAHGTLWFTEPQANQIGSFNLKTHAFTETAVPSANGTPYGITGPDANGAMWFAENYSAVSRVASFVPPAKGALTTAAISEYLATGVTGNTTIHLITLDHKGRVWWSEGFDGRIGSLTISQAVKGTSKGVTEYHTPSCGNRGTHVSGIAVDNSGIVWYDDSLGNCVGSYNPATNTFGQSALLANNSHPHDGLIVASDNTVYVVEEFGNRIGEILQSNPTPIATPKPTKKGK